MLFRPGGGSSSAKLPPVPAERAVKNQVEDVEATKQNRDPPTHSRGNASFYPPYLLDSRHEFCCWWLNQPDLKRIYSQNGNLSQVGVNITTYLKPPPPPRIYSYPPPPSISVKMLHLNPIIHRDFYRTDRFQGSPVWRRHLGSLEVSWTLETLDDFFMGVPIRE